MKNTLLPLSPEHAGMCLNLRPDTSGPYECLVPVMAPAVIDCRPWRTVGIYIEDNDNMVELFADGSVLGACSHSIDDDPPQPYVVADWLDGDIVDTYRCSDGYMILIDKAIYHAVYDGEGLMRCYVAVSPSDYPVPDIEVVSETSFSLPVESFRLSGNYGNGNTRLQAADADRLRSVLYETYCQGCADASANGQYIAPVLVRYRLYDRTGSMLMESMPKLLVPSGRHDRSMTAVLSVDPAGGIVMPGAVTVPVFRIMVTLPVSAGGVAGQRVDRLDIQVTPAIHCVDGNLSSVHRLETSSGRVTLQATLPGCDASGKATPRYRRDIKNALMACEDLFETVLSVRDPFSYEKTGHTLHVRPVARSLREEKSLLSEAVAESIPHWLTRCMLPHTVWGRVARRDGDTTLLGNISVGLFSGHPAEYYINHSSKAGDMETVAVVTFDDGRRLVTRGVSHSLNGMKLSPCVVYPDSHARSVYLQFKGSEGSVSGITLNLEPCGRFACYLADDVWPVEPDAIMYETDIPAEISSAVHYPGNIISYRGDVPGNNISGKEISMGCINAICPVGQPSSSAWESSRARYNVMMSDGIFSLSMNGCRIAAAVCLDSRPVMRRDAVTTVYGTDTGIRVYAIAGTDIVAVYGNKVITLARSTEAGILVWNRLHAELVAIPAAASGISRALVYHADSGGWSLRLLPGISAAYGCMMASRATSVCDGVLYDMCREVGEMSRCMYIREDIIEKTHPVRGIPYISEITVDLTGGDIDGTVTVGGHHGRGPWSVFSLLTVSGQVCRPLCHHIMMPSRRCVRVTVDAMMSADSRLGSIIIKN